MMEWKEDKNFVHTSGIYTIQADYAASWYELLINGVNATEANSIDELKECAERDNKERKVK